MNSTQANQGALGANGDEAERGGLPKPPEMVAQGVDVRFAKRGLGYEPFAEGRKAGLHQTEQPTSWHCPGQHRGMASRACFIAARPVRRWSGLRLVPRCRGEEIAP
jgi:hypothetical protein